MHSSFHSRRTSSKKSSLLRLLWWTILLILLFLVGQEIYYRILLNANHETTMQAMPFEIAKNELPASISNRLAEKGFISSKWAFMKYADRSGDAQNFQAGRFYLQQGLTIPTLSHLLTRAAPEEISVTIPEGFTNADIDTRLTELGLISKGEFTKCVANCDFSAFPFLPADAKLREGFFFPDTYFVSSSNFSVEQFAKRLLKTFDEKTKSIFGSATRNGWDILKMASIIEKETRTPEEMPIVADILWKRLDNDWMLGADATTRYIVGKTTEPLTVEDLALQSPWNTRASRGLPPGAICNPGLTAIKAAANPEKTEYWYYLHDKNGQVHYATTNDKHNTNKYKYLQ